MKNFVIGKYGDDTRRLVTVEDNSYLNNLVFENGDVFEAENGTLEGLYISGEYILECECDFFYEVTYEEISRELDYYGTGYDKIVALVDGEEETLKASRWSTEKQLGYEFVQSI